MRKYILVVFCLFVSACASKSDLKRSYDDGYAKAFDEANSQCVDIQKKSWNYIQQLQSDLDAKNARLKSFNQINPDGSLRYATPKDMLPNDEVTGEESWQK